MWTKLVGQALLPLNLAIEAVLLALLLRRLGRRRLAAFVFWVGFGVLLLASIPVVSHGLVRGLEGQYPPSSIEATPTADAIVVLGGALAPIEPPRRSAELTDGSDRVLHAARLFRAKKAPLVIASGGAGPDGAQASPESQDLADLLVEWGVPREAIVKEGSSGDTHENAVETQRILAARGLKRVLLVTSALHMPRALAVFQRAGVEAIPCPTDFLAVDPPRRTVQDYLPDSEALLHSTAAVHEWIGRLWYRVRGWE